MALIGVSRSMKAITVFGMPGRPVRHVRTPRRDPGIHNRLELFDREMPALGNLVGGHALRPLAAAAGGVVVCRRLMLRTLKEPEARQRSAGAQESA
jgi:hypothetical protein